MWWTQQSNYSTVGGPKANLARPVLSKCFYNFALGLYDDDDVFRGDFQIGGRFYKFARAAARDFYPLN